MKVRRFDRFTFDMETGELRKGDSPIKLHPQPAQLLQLLVSRAGEIVVREEIQKALWPDDTFVDYAASINSCIRQIRTALEDDAEKPRFIETIPKRGYRFIAPVEISNKPPRRKRWLLPAAAVIAIALAVWLLWPSGGEDVPEETSKPSVAVLYFENASGDPELDWLRTGLTEMLVTDLSTIPHVDVVSTNRLFQILKSTRPTGRTGFLRRRGARGFRTGANGQDHPRQLHESRRPDPNRHPSLGPGELPRS